MRQILKSIVPFSFGIGLIPFFVNADEMQSAPRRTDRPFPQNQALDDAAFRDEHLSKLQEQVDAQRKALDAPSAELPLTNSAPLPVDVAVPEDEKPKKKSSKPQGGSGLLVFTTTQKVKEVDTSFTVLPMGSHVKARVVSGVEANSREPYPVLIQLDYAFTGPNKTKVDLSNCFMLAKAKANLSTERVLMETEKLSCVRANGEHYERDSKGYIAGADSTFGATGTYISKQGQVLLASVLASIAKNAGQAVADAQKTTSVFGIGADKAQSASSVTGSQAAFIGGSALVDGAGLVANWYLEQAKELIPSIGVGSGQDVFVVMLETVKVPALEGGDQ